MRTNSILIVDDDEKLCALLKSYFEQEQFIVYVAHDGMTALHTLRNQKPQIMLLDLMMPGMDGIEVLKRTRAAGKRLPIIMLTAKSEVSDKVEGLDAGANDYLTKPFAAKELLARIRAMTPRLRSMPRRSVWATCASIRRLARLWVPWARNT